MLRKVIATFLASMLLSAGITFIGVSRAEAVTCQLSHVCLWSGAAYTGSLTRYGVSNTSGVTGCKGLLNDSMNNNTESMANGSYKFIQFFNSHNCSGSVIGWLHATTTPGGVKERSSLPGWANVISSFRYCPTDSPAC